MPRIRNASALLATFTALMLAFSPERAPADYAQKIVEETTSNWLIEGRQLGNLTTFGTRSVFLGTLWHTDMSIEEWGFEGPNHNDKLGFIMQSTNGPLPFWSSWHIVPPHGEGENANRAMGEIGFDAEAEYKGGMWTEADKGRAGFLPHGQHWDLFVMTASCVVAPAYDILSYSWLVFGKHTSKSITPPVSYLSGHVDDGTTTSHLGAVVGLADTADNYVDVAGIVQGISPSDVMSGSVRAGPSGPIIVNLPLQSMADDEGNLTINAHFLFFDHSALPSLQQQAYLELVTTQGVIGGNLGTIGSGLVGVGESHFPERVELQAPYPDPARSGIGIRYGIPPSLSRQTLDLAVYDVIGRRVRTIEQGPAESGEATRIFDLRSDDGRKLGNGLYFLRLRVGAAISIRKFAIVD